MQRIKNKTEKEFDSAVTFEHTIIIPFSKVAKILKLLKYRYLNIKRTLRK